MNWRLGNEMKTGPSFTLQTVHIRDDYNMKWAVQNIKIYLTKSKNAPLFSSSSMGIIRPIYPTILSKPSLKLENMKIS